MLSNNRESNTFKRKTSVLSLRTKSELVRLAEQLFDEEGSAETLGVDKTRLRALIEKVSWLYRDNPYHNFHHAVDTVNTIVWMVTRPIFKANLPTEHRFLLLFAALTHDVQHPGHNNAFEVGTHSELAKRYNNTAVLEYYSLEIIGELLDDPDYNLFSHMGEETEKRWREILQGLILATDFQAHQAFMDEFQVYMKTKLKPDFEDPDFLSWVTRGLMKAADISNTSKPFDEAKLWGRRVMMEFWAQGLKEKRNNLQVGPLNDPETIKLNATQAGFIRFAAMDLFIMLGELDPAFKELVNNLTENLKRYEDIVAAGESLFE